MLLRTATRVVRRHTQQAPMLLGLKTRHASSARRELSFAEELMQHRKTQGKTVAARRSRASGSNHLVDEFT